jgi:hypothetical protein
MKAIARLAWTYLTAFPILRWVGIGSLASLPFAVLAIWHRGFIALPIIAFAIQWVSMTIAAGYLFRVLSAPRSHRFLPHFRGRSLTAFLAIVALVTSPWLVLGTLAALSQPYTVQLVAPLFIMTLAVGIAFFPVGAAVTFAVLIAISWAVPQLAGPPAPRAAPPDIVLGPVAISVFLLGVWAALWVLFSVWYLRVRRIEPFQPAAVILDKIGIRRSPGSVVFDRGSAMAATLSAAYPEGAKQMGVWIALLIIGTKLAAGFARGAHVPYTAVIFVPALMIPGVVLVAIASTLARRTKSLWLKSGLSRRDLLAATEKQIWRTVASRSLALSVVLSIGIALTYDVPVPVLARALASAAATATLAVYLGVALVRDSRVIAAGLAALVFASAGVALWAVFTAPARDDVWLAATLSQVAVALAFRAVAISRWRKIDWLVFKPIRIWSQSLR